MRFVSTRFRIAFGLICMLASVLLLAIVAKIIPDRREAVLDGRAKLCESVAVNSSILVNRADLRRLEAILGAIVRRNDELLSAAVRRTDGRVEIEIGDHAAHWNDVAEERSIESHIQVGIFAGEEKWGRVEFCFQPTSKAGVWGVITSSWTRLIVFVCALAFILFYYYLGKMLQHLDPSKAVPGRVRSALDTLAEGLLVLDKKGRIVLANEAFAADLGEEPEKLIGRDAARLGWTQADGTPAARPYPWEQALQLEAPQLGVMMGKQRSDGRKHIFMVNCNPIMGAEGQYRGVLTSFDDVTQLEETKVQLAESKEAAESANQAKSEFLARMSHEIRTPMNAILGFTDVLRRGIEVGEQERIEYLSTIHSSGQHLLNLINDILDLSKVEAGKLEVESKECPPLEIVAEIVSVLQARAAEQEISLDFETDGPVPATIVSDPTRIRQIITNLVGNAVKFTRQGGVRVVAQLKTIASEPRLVIHIVDSGVGMPPETLDKIFDPFVQADTSVTRQFGGTGLGLSISKRFVEALGGELSVASEEGKGSVFSVMLPTGPLEGVAMVTADEVRAARKEAAAGPQSLALPPSRILVADDGAANRKLLELVLSRAGVEVVAVENGKLALERGTSESFDIILMDMQMPVMDGATATTRLREQGVTIPIIALTADAMKGSEEKCRAAGCSGFLTKPIDMDLLVRTLAAELGEIPQPAEPPGDEKTSPAESEPASASATERPEVTPSSPTVRRSSLSTEPAAAEQPPLPLVSDLPMDDPEVKEIVVGWTGKLGKQLDAMRDAAAESDHESLAQLAHWLKGSAGTVGFHAFTEPARALQEHARDGQVEAIEALLAEINELSSRIALPDESAVANR